jgi:oligosaccharide reducing-end xylanase
MKQRSMLLLLSGLLPLLLVMPINTVNADRPMMNPETTDAQVQPAANSAFVTGKYPNLFGEIGKTEAEIKARLDKVWDQLFYGDDATQRVYYPVGSDMAYMKDIGNNDIRSEGISYGMMIAVQMNKQEEFNRLWKWAKTYMQHQSGARKGYFAWQMNESGQKLDPNPASDGEEYFITALLFAAGRWGNGAGIFNYQAEANEILRVMLHKEEDNGGIVESVTNMFNLTQKQVTFVAHGSAAGWTDPSYHLPAFYELWARWSPQDNKFWYDAAATSREFFKKAAHPTTGLFPDYAEYSGAPKAAPWGGGHEDFRFDAWRVASNVAVDYVWFGIDPWQVTQSNRMLSFFTSKGIDSYGNQYKLDGTPLSSDHSTGLVAMNAVAAMASTNADRMAYVERLWNLTTPGGQWRYYDGLLYMMGLLHVSGNFRIYAPGKLSATPAATGTP